MLSGKQVHTRDLSSSHQHYLRAIWETRSQRGYARLSDVARLLGIAPSTLSAGLRPLESRGLIAHDDHRFLLLTADGERTAREVHHRYAVTRAFLEDVLGIPEPQAMAEACLLEHDLSARTTDRLLDLIKLLREDGELQRFFQERFDAFHRTCRTADRCATCDLGCLAAAPDRA